MTLGTAGRSESKAAALGQTDARAVARAVRAGLRERAWAVRGEVPLEDDRSACGCTTVVFGGIRMHVPEKLFACSWMELRHAASGVVLCFDGVSALRRWAALSLELIDDRRAGQPAWSGWSGDASQLRSAWAESAWAETTAYSRREEWDWSYRTDYAGTAHAGAAAAGLCERRVAVLEEHRLICAARKRPKADPEAAEAALPWAACSAEEAEAAEGGAAAWADADEATAERTLKLYEDWLSELGLCNLCVRLREFEHGWEVRVRWWFCLNPGREPKRGVPHARLRESTTRLRYGAAALVRRTEERCLYFEPGGEEEEGAASLDADALRPRMPLVGDPTCEVLALDDGCGWRRTDAGGGGGGGADGGGGVVGGGGR